MRKVLYILGQLDDRDVEWMARHGLRRTLPRGHELIRQGERTTALYIVLDGTMSVSIKGLGNVAELGAGEMLGELSFVDSAPPSASVTAGDAVQVLELRKSDLEAKLAEDDGFARRFYKAIALFLADRLRGTVRRMGYAGGAMADDEILEDELDENLLDTVSIAGDRYDRLIRTLSSARVV